MPRLISAYNTVIIGVGSNIRPKENIQKARKILSKQCQITAQSKFTKTKPVGYKNQNNFLNGALVILTPWTQTQLKSVLKKIELQLGRNQKRHSYGPRTIDLDILVWNGKIIDRDFYTRNFTRKSVLMLMPGLTSHKSISSKARPYRS